MELNCVDVDELSLSKRLTPKERSCHLEMKLNVKLFKVKITLGNFKVSMCTIGLKRVGIIFNLICFSRTS